MSLVEAASFTLIPGAAPGCSRSGTAVGVSDDGKAVAGQSCGAARWTEADGWESLGTLPGGSPGVSYVKGISADGKVVVGESDSDSPDGNEGDY